MAVAQLVTRLAFATPFLLLSCCRSLHVTENGHGLQQTLIFGTHHKTGSELVKDSSNCFDSVFNYTQDPHWEGGQLRPNDKAVHLIRNPVSLALSAYLYHKETGESWTLQPGGPDMETLAEDPFTRRFLSNRSESYTDFLRRVSEHVGIRAQLLLLDGELLQIATAEKFCETSSHCMQMCLEDFTLSSDSYDNSWNKVLHFMGKRTSRSIHRCLLKYDLNRNPLEGGHAGHATSNSLPEWKYNQLRGLVEEADAKFFNSRLKKMGQGVHACDASNFLHTQAGPNAAHGGEYKGWLIAEGYA